MINLDGLRKDRISKCPTLEEIKEKQAIKHSSTKQTTTNASR